MNTHKDFSTPDKRLAAVCGLFCPACTIFIGTREDPNRLGVLAARIQKPIEELKCTGCRTETRCFYCREKCMMSNCASERGVDFCGECPEYPCDDLKVFQAAMPPQNRIMEIPRADKTGRLRKMVCGNDRALFMSEMRHY